MAGVCRPLSICARTVGGAALFVGVVLVACSINKPIYVALKAGSIRGPEPGIWTKCPLPRACAPSAVRGSATSNSIEHVMCLGSMCGST